MHLYDRNKVFHIFSDASLLGHGYIAVQCEPAKAALPFHERDYQLIACHQRAFSSRQQHYPTLEQEALGVVYILQNNPDLFMRGDCNLRTQVFVDHVNVTICFAPGYATTKPQRSRLAEWQSIIAPYMSFFDIQYIAGEKNVWADYMSRSFGVAPAEGQIASFYSTHAQFAFFGADSAFELPSFAELRQYSPKDAPAALYTKNALGVWTSPDGLFFIPDCSNLRERFLVAVHCGCGHKGITSCTQVLQRFVWWPNLRMDVAHFIRHCIHCLASMANRELHRPLGTPPHATQPGIVIILDNKVMPPSHDGIHCHRRVCG
jgi:hypothetical protein